MADAWSQKYQVDKYHLRSPALYKNVSCGIWNLEMCDFSSQFCWTSGDLKEKGNGSGSS